MKDKNRQQFDEHAIYQVLRRASQTFSRAAFLPHEIGKRILSRLDFVHLAPNVILDCGAKDGLLSQALLARYPQATVISQEIIADFQQQLKSHSCQQWLCSPVHRLPLANDSVDVIVCNLWLQQENDLAACFTEFYRVLKANGALFFTLYGPDTLHELRNCFQAVSPYAHVHEFVDMHNIGDILLQSHFMNPVMDMELITLTYTTVLDMLQELKGTGATNVRRDRHRGLLGKNRWQQMLAQYETLKSDNRIPATFEIIYGHAWVPKQKSLRNMNIAGEVVIPIDQITHPY